MIFLFSNNHRRTKRNISSYDFQTFNTHIPRHQLKTNLKKFKHRAFDIKEKEFICITKKTGFFSTKSHNNLCCFTVSGLMSAISYLIGNSFLVFIKKLERSNKTKEFQILTNIFRFQDDLLVLNDH